MYVFEKIRLKSWLTKLESEFKNFDQFKRL